MDNIKNIVLIALAVGFIALLVSYQTLREDFKTLRGTVSMIELSNPLNESFIIKLGEQELTVKSYRIIIEQVALNYALAQARLQAEQAQQVETQNLEE